jgi:hypothetical protein
VNKLLRAGAVRSRNNRHVPVKYPLVHCNENTDIPTSTSQHLMRLNGISFTFLANVVWIRGVNETWVFFLQNLFSIFQNLFTMLQAFCGAERIPSIQFLKNVFGNDFVLKIQHALARHKAKVVNSAGGMDRHGDAARVLSRQTRLLMRVVTFEPRKKHAKKLP